MTIVDVTLIAMQWDRTQNYVIVKQTYDHTTTTLPTEVFSFWYFYKTRERFWNLWVSCPLLLL